MDIDPRKITVRQVRIALAGLVAMIVFGAVNIYFSYQNYWQKVELEQEIQKFRMTRTMLDARATIQITLINAASEGRALTASEKTQIDRLWIAAEYDIEKRPK